VDTPMRRHYKGFVMKIRGDEIYLSETSAWEKVSGIEAFVNDPSPTLAVGHEVSSGLALDRAKAIGVLTGKNTTAHVKTYRDGKWYWILVGGFCPLKS